MRGVRRLAWPARLSAIVLALAQVTVAFTPASAAGTSAGFDAGLAAQLKGILDNVRSGKPIVGLGSTVILADGTRWEGGSGLAVLRDTGRPFGAHTPSVAGSITKTFVAALIMQLIEEGKLTLGDRLVQWVPEKPFPGSIRIRHLLRHTSGIRDFFYHPDYQRLVFKRPTHVWTKNEVLALIRPDVRFKPGTAWKYSNSGYFLLGMIAERATGSTLGAELKRRFFTPLGLDETWVQGEHALPAGGAHGYLYSGGQWRGFADGTNFRPHTSAATVAWAAGNILSSPSDIADWTRALYGGEVVSQASLAQMTNFNSYGYGFGTTLRNIGDGTLAWGHNGSLRGFTAVTWYIPEHQLTVTVMTNRGRIQPDAIGRQVTNAIMDWEPTPPPTPSPTPPTPSPSPIPPTPSPSPIPPTPSPSPTNVATPTPTIELTPSPTVEITPSPDSTPTEQLSPVP